MSEPVVPPEPVAPEAPPVVDAPPRFALRLDDGRAFAVHERVILGRDPQRSRRDDADALLIVVDDAGHTVSPTHVAIMWMDNRLFVEDRGSVSGSAVMSPSGVQTNLKHAMPIQVGDGWLVAFGSRRAQVSRM